MSDEQRKEILRNIIIRMNELKEKMKSIQYLPVKEFKKHFSKMYDSVNNDEKEEMICLFEKGIDEHILRIDSFIEETKMKMKFNEMFEPQLV